MVFGEIFGAIGQGVNFLGSSGGQALLGAAGQAFKVKELGWVPGATGGGGGAPIAQPQPIDFPPMGGPVFASPGANVGGAAQAVGGAALHALDNPFGQRVVELAGRKMLDRWARATSMPVQGADVISMGQADDREMAKLAVKHAVIPADSDIGQMLVLGGAKPTTRNVKMSDGTTIRMRVVEAKGATRRKRRNYNTVAGRRAAARTLTQMGQQMRTYKRLAKLGAQVDRAMNPKAKSGGACCPPKRATRSRCK